MEAPNTIVNAKLSSCCKTSISPIYGEYKNQGEFIPFHYICNKCGKNCEKIEIAAWIVTEEYKYRELDTYKEYKNNRK